MEADTSSVPAADCWVMAEIFSIAVEIFLAPSSIISLSWLKLWIDSVMYWMLWTISLNTWAVSSIMPLCMLTISSLALIFSLASFTPL
ncbi:hypothetical protein D3C75_1296850 [compost metagenome]